MRNRLLTIFGGTGFIGRYVVGRLAERGARLRVISRSPDTHGHHLQPLGRVDQIVVQSADLGSEAALRRALAGAAGVVNLIGILHETGRQSFAEVQGAVPGRIAAAASAEGVGRMVQISAIGADPASASAYARSKAEGERRVLEAFPEATVLRPSIVIGPEDGFFNRFAALARISPMVPLIGGGRTRFQPVYVGDVAQAVVAALEREDCRGQIYELGGP
ncbi:MAG: complex I NDUFA9 subunit family protein, partial [Geminicoccaceae bacterium]